MMRTGGNVGMDRIDEIDGNNRGDVDYENNRNYGTNVSNEIIGGDRTDWSDEIAGNDGTVGLMVELAELAGLVNPLTDRRSANRANRPSFAMLTDTGSVIRPN